MYFFFHRVYCVTVKTKNCIHFTAVSEENERYSLFRSWPVPGSEIVGSVELRKRKHENKAGGNWGEQGRRSL